MKMLFLIRFLIILVMQFNNECSCLASRSCFPARTSSDWGMQQTAREESTSGHYRSHREGKERGYETVACCVMQGLLGTLRFSGQPSARGAATPANEPSRHGLLAWDCKTHTHTHTNAMTRPGFACIPPWDGIKDLSTPPSLSLFLSCSISNQPSCWIIQSKHWPTFTHREHARRKARSGLGLKSWTGARAEREREEEQRTNLCLWSMTDAQVR